MPCESCNSQFTIFKRKRMCTSCQRLFCTNCLGKKNKKSFCARCEIFHLKPCPSKQELMELKTKDLIFYLQSKKIPIAGIVEKEELCNLIINHVNTNSYYETATSFSSSSTTPNNDFENYTNSFEKKIKDTCQNLFTSITDKIASDLQKTTCFNQSANQQNRKPPHVTTQQPRSSNPTTISPQSPSSAHTSNYPGASNVNSSSRFSANIPCSSVPSTSSSVSPMPLAHQHNDDCNCADDELAEISEKRQSIFDGNPVAGTSGSNVYKKTKLNHNTSSESSFEELEPLATNMSSEDTWQVIETSSTNGIRAVEKPVDDLVSVEDVNTIPSPNQVSTNSNEMCRSFVPESSSTAVNTELRRLTRRRSDSSLLNLRKSSSFNIDMSGFDPSTSNFSGNEVRKLKVSCKKCGKAKRNIKQEIVKLSEQLRTSNRSEQEVSAKIKEFLDYLESKSQPSDMTETENSDLPNTINEHETDGARYMASSNSHDEIEENIFDENEGINVYPTVANIPSPSNQPTPVKSLDDVAKRFISLNDIHTGDDLETMSVKQLKEILMLNRVDFKGCCEKQELKERVQRLWKEHVSAPKSDLLTTEDLCKICMDAPIECVFLECGHMATCTNCGKVLSECPICRCFIVRIVRTFKS